MARERVEDRKKKLIPLCRKAVKLYKRSLANKTTRIDCLDGYRLIILWPENRIMHLCGITGCTRPPEYVSKGPHHMGEADYFYKMLAKPKGRLASRSLVVADFRQAESKLNVLPYMLEEFHTAIGVVDSSKQEIDFFVGDTVWCLGLFHDVVLSTKHGMTVYIPRSFIPASLCRKREPDKRFHIIERIVTV